MEKKQFDAFLGGSESLPHDVSIMKFVSARAHEISAITSSLGMFFSKLYYMNINISVVYFIFLLFTQRTPSKPN